jgi:hypothetical protein
VLTGNGFRPVAARAAIALGLLVAFAPGSTADSPHDPYADAPAYIRRVAPRTQISPIVTTGQRIPLTGGQADDTFLVVGIPDGMGFYRHADNSFRLLFNHEFANNQGGAAGPLPRGARVSELILAQRNNPNKPVEVVSGKYFTERVYAGEPAVLIDPVTRGFGRLCSGFLGTPQDGFDRYIYFNGEEADAAATFDGRGGQAWAHFDDETWGLPRCGRAAWENIVPVWGTGEKTVLVALEDGPSSGDGLNSHLYLYVGDKVANSNDPLEKNGLSNGQVYVFGSDDLNKNSEATFTEKNTSITGHWTQLDYNLTDVEFDTASRAANGMAFVRIEDGTPDFNLPGVFYFVTTGRPESANPFGRLYSLHYDPTDPLGPAQLTLLLDGSEGVVSPDNIDINRFGELAICEDPNYNLETDLRLERDSSVWIYDVPTAALTRIAEIDRPRAKAHALVADSLNSNVVSADTPGGWETAGVVDAEEWFTRGSWILNVEAHSLRINPTAETVQGGQIMYMNWKPLGRLPRVLMGNGGEWQLADEAEVERYGVSASPNPFNPATTIRFKLPSASQVELKIYDAYGRHVRTLVDGNRVAGAHAVAWDGMDDRQARVSSGLYFYALRAGEFRTVEKLVLLK